MLHKIKAFIQLSILILALILGISLIKSITKINGSNQKIIEAQKEVNDLQKQNQELNHELSVVKSAEFIESQARDKLGLAKKGEIVVVLPDDSSLRLLAPKLVDEKAVLPMPVWQKWLKLFL